MQKAIDLFHRLSFSMLEENVSVNIERVGINVCGCKGKDSNLYTTS